MLRRNGQVYELSTAERQELDKIYPEKTIRLKYDQSMIVANRKDPRVKHMPPSVSIPLVSTRNTKSGGIEEWRYCESINGDGSPANPYRYFPDMLTVTAKKNNGGSYVVHSEASPNYELLYYLHHICKYVSNGANAERDLVTKLVLERRKEENEKAFEVEKQKALVSTILFSEQLNDQQIFKLAKACEISIIDKDAKELSVAMHKMATDNPRFREKLISMYKNREDQEKAAAIQHAIDLGIIANKANRWIFADQNQRQISTITAIRNEGSARTELYVHMLENQQTFQTMIEYIEKQDKTFSSGGLTNKAKAKTNITEN